MSTSPTNSKGSTRLNFDPKQYYHHLEQLPQAQPQLQQQFTEQFQILNLNKDLCERNTATRTNKKKLRASGNILTADQISRTSSTSPALMSPVFTNDLLSPSPELTYLSLKRTTMMMRKTTKKPYLMEIIMRTVIELTVGIRMIFFSCMTTPTKTLTQLLMVCFKNGFECSQQLYGYQRTSFGPSSS